MSTKIWDAVRVPLSHLAEAQDYIHEAYMALVDADYDKMMNTLLMNEVEEFYEARHHHAITQQNSNYAKHLFIQDQLLNLKKKTGDSFSFMETGYHLWISGKYAYLMFWGSYAHHLYQSGGGPVALKPEVPDYIQEFHYQNQTDRPEGITARQYAVRRDRWDEILDTHIIKARKLRHTIHELDFSCLMYTARRWNDAHEKQEAE